MMKLTLFVLKSLYLLLPAYLANAAPVLFKGTFKPLAKPIAPRIKLRGKPIFGTHKTFRGLFVAAIMGILIFLLQEWLYNYSFFQSISFVDYDAIFQRFSILPGFLLGFGAIFGDLVESAIKRQLNIKPGKPWMPFDQLDFIIGALIFIYFIYFPSWQIIVTLLIASPLIHISANHIAYYLKIRKVKW